MIAQRPHYRTGPKGEAGGKTLTCEAGLEEANQPSQSQSQMEKEKKEGCTECFARENQTAGVGDSSKCEPGPRGYTGIQSHSRIATLPAASRGSDDLQSVGRVFELEHIGALITEGKN